MYIKYLFFCVYALFSYQVYADRFEHIAEELTGQRSPDFRFGNSLLYTAVERGRADLVAELCDLTFDEINIRKSESFDYISPLHRAVLDNNPEIASILITHCRANLNLTSYHKKYTALHIAVMENQIGIAQKLLEAGASPEIKSKWNMTPLHHAVFEQNLAMVELLLNFKANIDERTFSKIHPGSALRLAISRKNLPIADLLLQRGANPDLPSRDDGLALTPRQAVDFLDDPIKQQFHHLLIKFSPLPQ